jgi:preprotein translocase subunit Sec61beta
VNTVSILCDIFDCGFVYFSESAIMKVKSKPTQNVVSASLVVGAIVLCAMVFRSQGLIQIDLTRGQILIDGRSSEKTR